MTYENLLAEAHNENISVIENALFKSESNGLISGNVIGLNKKIRSTRKRACTLSEELGHYHTTVGNIINQSSAAERKQEHRARVWAFEKMVGLSGIVKCYEHGCFTPYEMADCLEITEDFLAEALQYYRSKYGIFTTIDNYVIYFEPSIGVFELI